MLRKRRKTLGIHFLPHPVQSDGTELGWTNTVQFLTNQPMGEQSTLIGHQLTHSCA